jgi:hypothetical protein
MKQLMLFCQCWLSLMTMKSELKIELHSLIDKIEDERILNAVYTLLNLTRKKYPFEPESNEEFLASIQEAEKDVAEGRVFTHEEVKQHFRNKK